MGRYEDFSRERLENMTDLLLDVCLHFAGAQYTESILRSRGFKDMELEAVGFDVDGEWAGMDACAEG